MPLSCNSPTRSGSQPLTRSERPASEPTSPHIPTGSRTYSSRRARHSTARFSLTVAATSPSPIPMSPPPRESIPRHRERSRRDRQPEPCSRGPRDHQGPNRTQPPGRAQTCHIEEQTQPHRHPTPRQPTQRFREGNRMRYHAGIPGNSRLHTPVPRETEQPTRVVHKNPPALNTDQAMNLFRDKTIKLLERAMRIARGRFAFGDGAGAPLKHEAHVQRIRTFLSVDP